jgi:hypothetical protein
VNNEVTSSLKFATIYIPGNANSDYSKMPGWAAPATSNLHNTCFNLAVRILTISSFVYGVK